MIYYRLDVEESDPRFWNEYESEDGAIHDAMRDPPMSRPSLVVCESIDGKACVVTRVSPEEYAKP